MSSAAIQQPTASIIESMPFEQYIEIQDVHATALKEMHVSPRLYAHRRKNKRTDSDALRVGRACHTAVLEPDRFALEYAVWRKSSGIRRGEKWETFKAANNGRTHLTEAQYEQALKVRDAVRSHAIARRYLDEDGRNELTIRWQDPRTGLPCVARLDRLCSAIMDLKTTRNPAPGKFSSDSARLGYALQAAFYADGYAAATGEAPPFKFIAAQSVEPWDVVVFDAPEDVLRVGRDQYERALDRLIECTKTKQWPGIAANEEVTLRLPIWAAPDYDEEGPDESQPVEDTDF